MHDIYVVDTEATKACTSKGLVLPKNTDLEELRGCFGEGSGDYMTSDGLQAMHEYFPKLKNKTLWSATMMYCDYKCYLNYAFNSQMGSLNSSPPKHALALCVENNLFPNATDE